MKKLLTLLRLCGLAVFGRFIRWKMARNSKRYFREKAAGGHCTYPIYHVQNGQIWFAGQTYPNLRDYGAAGQIGNEDSVDNPKVIRERGANHLVIAVYRDHWHVAQVGGYTPDTGLYTKLY